MGPPWVTPTFEGHAATPILRHDPLLLILGGEPRSGRGDQRLPALQHRMIR